MKKVIAIALAVLMLSGLATVVFAENSPSADVYHSVTIKEDYGDKTEEHVESVKDGDSITVTAEKKEGYEFVEIIVNGEHHAVDSVTFTPDGDTVVTIVYKAVTSDKPGDTDNGNTSPDTGVDFALIALVAIFGFCGAVVATKKLFEN